MPERCGGKNATARCRCGDRSRPLRIEGPPGIGKSTLALAVLQDDETRAKFGARRYWIRCDEFSSTDLLIEGMGVRWFGLTPNPNMRGQLKAALAAAPAAVAIDNFETLWAYQEGERRPSEGWLAELLGLGNVWLMVTIQGHHQPGTLEWQAVEPARLGEADATELFCRVSGQRQHVSDPRLPELLRDLEGVPHAIQLMARQSSSEDSLSGLEERWREFHTAMLRDGPGKDRTDSLDASYEFALRNPLLDADAGGNAHRLLRILAAVPGGRCTRGWGDGTDARQQGFGARGRGVAEATRTGVFGKRAAAHAGSAA